MSLLLLAMQGCMLFQADATNEAVAPSKIVSVGLFKNGLAVIKSEVTLPGPGTFRLSHVPDPVHGTFWVSSSHPVETSVQMSTVEVDAESAGPVQFREDLEGKKVTLHFYNEKIPPIAGTVLARRKATSESANDETLSMEDYSIPRYRPSTSTDDFLIVQTATKRIYLRMSQIAYAEMEASGKVKRKLPVLTFNVPAPVANPITVLVTYMAHGLSWAPSYHVDISDPKTLKLEQAAVIRNELTGLLDTEVFLISGFPSIQFSNVTSPMSARTSWAQFFQQLRGMGARSWQQAEGQMVMTQNAVTGNFYGRDVAPVDGGAANVGDGIDLHYQSIGKRTLKEGDVFALTVAKGETSYEKIVEWLIPDLRDEFGSYRGNNQNDDDNVAWDALRYKNPLSFPMTTGPAFVSANGKFGGQRLSGWVNAGEETLLRVNKALSIRTRNTEVEVQVDSSPSTPGGVRSNREEIWIGGRRFRQSKIEGEITLCNHRKQPINMMVRRRFSGDLEKADGNPTVTLREEGVWSVNRRNEMIWNLELKPGEEKKLKYYYSILIHW